MGKIGPKFSHLLMVRAEAVLAIKLTTLSYDNISIAFSINQNQFGGSVWLVTPTGSKFSSRFLTMLFSQLTSVSIQFSAEVMFSKTMLGKKTVSASDGLSLFKLLSFFRFL